MAVGRWHLPGTMDGDDAPPPKRLPAQFDAGFRAHNTNVYPERPDRCYLAYIDGGVMVLDISDRARPKMLSHWTNSPPYNGFNHTVLPLFGRGLLVVSDECVQDNGADWPKLVWVLDARDETNLVSVSTLPAPPVDAFKTKGGRFGAHNLHENPPVPGAWRSEDIVLGTFFNAGVRAYDVSDPYSPREIAYYVPPSPEKSKTGQIQLNDVFVDDRGIVFTVDRGGGGLYVPRNERVIPDGRTPVVVVTGFLGSGKTTLVNQAGQDAFRLARDRERVRRGAGRPSAGGSFHRRKPWRCPTAASAATCAATWRKR